MGGHGFPEALWLRLGARTLAGLWAARWLRGQGQKGWGRGGRGGVGVGQAAWTAGATWVGSACVWVWGFGGLVAGGSDYQSYWAGLEFKGLGLQERVGARTLHFWALQEREEGVHSVAPTASVSPERRYGWPSAGCPCGNGSAGAASLLGERGGDISQDCGRGACAPHSPQIYVTAGGC